MSYVKDCFGEDIRVGNAMHPHTPTQVDVEMNGLRADNARLRAQVEELKRERDSLRACHDSELGVCHQHCEEVQEAITRATRAEAQAKRYRVLLEEVASVGWQHEAGCHPSSGRHTEECKRKRALSEQICKALEGGE